MRGCERSAIDSCHCERSAAIFLVLSLRACEAISLFAVAPSVENRDRAVPRDCIFCHCERSAAIFLVLSLRACEAISLLAVCQPFTTEIATFLAMTGLRRDRHDPRNCIFCHCEPAKQSLFSVFAHPRQPRSPRCALDDRIYPREDRIHHRDPVKGL